MAEKDRYRTKEIRVKVFEEELYVAREKARLCGISMSEFIRKQILDGYALTLVNKELALRMIDEFNAIGVNINQIAYMVNTNKVVLDKDIENLKEQVAEMHQIVMNYLYSGEM